MYEGEFVDVVDPETVTEEDLGLLMAGHDSTETVEQRPTGVSGRE
jgi:simple sugar transport system ATP-binding protein